MADGYALIEINQEEKSKIKELKYFDLRHEDIDFDASEGLEQLVGQLPDELKDVLVMVIFDYQSNCERTWEGDWDCEELFNLVTYTVVKTDYKEFYREMVTLELGCGIDGIENIDAADDVTLSEKNYYKELVSDWEEFYDEDFKPFEKKPKQINVLKNWWSLK